MPVRENLKEQTFVNFMICLLREIAHYCGCVLQLPPPEEIILLEQLSWASQSAPGRETKVHNHEKTTQKLSSISRASC